VLLPGPGCQPAVAPHDPPQLCLLSYGTLNFVWLKFLTIWRLSRLWALIAGVDPPENILRCVSNNYSVQVLHRFDSSPCSCFDVR